MYQQAHSAKAVRKQQVRAAAEATPYGTLAAVRAFLDKFSPPEGSFDPNGAWKHGYEIHLNSSPAPYGYLEISREGNTLSVESAITHFNGAQQTKAKIVCAPDALATPRSWQLESIILDSSGRPVADARLTHTATLRGDTVEAQIGKHKRTSKVSLPFTSNWSLFDAVQRLPGKSTSPMRFALLEDLDLFKPNQRVSFAGKTEVSVAGGRQLALSGYERIGEGVLPYHYWVDDQHRLLFVLSGPRAYLYNPEARSAVKPGQKPRRRG